jgi:hypothetical protein
VPTIEDAIFARGSAFAGLTALLGTNPTRLYPVQAPQNAVTPYVTYQMISDPREHAMGADPGVAHPRFQFTPFAKTRTEAKAVTLQVIACYSRWSGTFASVDVLKSFLENEGDLGFDDTVLLFQRYVDFLMSHRE